MFPYLLTFMYILTICLLSSGESKRCYKLEILDQIKKEKEELRYYIKSLTAETNYFDFINANTDQYKNTQDSSEKTKSKSLRSEVCFFQQKNSFLNVDILRPPNNSRINLYAILLEPEDIRQHEFSWFSILYRLIVKKYLTKEALKEYKPEDVTQLLLNILQNKQKLLEMSLHDSSPDILFQLSLEDKKISKLLNHLLVGGENFPSLLCFLDCIPKKSINLCKLNFLFLDTYILEAIFIKSSLIVSSLKEIQEKVFKEILEQENIFQKTTSYQLLKTRRDFKLELQEMISKILLDSDYNVLLEKNLFDFSLGKIGSYFVIKGSQEHNISRFKYLLFEDSLIKRID